MKFITKTVGVAILFFGMFFQVNAQQVVVTDSTAIQPEEKPVEPKDTVTSDRRKVDGIAAVVGEYVILDSDIDLMYKDLKSQGVSTADVTDCQLAGNLMENKLYAHEAIQDSLVVSDAEIRSAVEQQLSSLKQQIPGGTMQDVLEYYHRDSEADFKNELFEIRKQGQLSNMMRQKIVEGVEITPDEVHAYFETIPTDSLPIFGDEVQISQIVIKPEIPEEEKQKVIDRLKQMREDIVDNDASFATKAVLYSQDGTSSDGGRMVITRKDHLDKDFKDVAFSLKEGEVSEPFASQFGYHIIKVDKINGQNLEIRHIILIPDVTKATVDQAKTQIDSIRTQILAKKLKFAQAAKKFSDEEETADDEGKLINPTTGDTRFELTKLDPDLYDKIVNLKEGEMSQVLTDHDRVGRIFYKIIRIDKRFPEHKADYAQDFNKIKELALRNKQFDAIEKWQKEKIANTYVKVNGKYRNCDYNSQWVKN